MTSATDNRTTEVLPELWSAGDRMSEYIVNTDDLMPNGSFSRSRGEIVRCRDCRCGYRFVRHGEECWQCANDYQNGIDVEPDAFCWLGERGDVDR